MRIRSCLFILAMALGIAALADTGIALAAEDGPAAGAVPGESLGAESDADIWRALRGGEAGTVSIPDKEAAVLIQSGGENWRNIRNGPISTIGAWLILGTIVVVALYFAIRGRIKIDGGRSGKMLIRFTLSQRIAHWFTAVLFVLLGATGLILLYGRYIASMFIGGVDGSAPGSPVFAVIASASLQAHNLFGPLFIAAIFMLFVNFVRGNGYSLIDLKWLVKLGGFFGGHAPSRFYNFGEKNWFWLSVLLGIVLSISGVLLEFPILLEERLWQQLAHISHAIAALLFIAVGLGHIYLGTVGMEGALEGMTRGEVDENWAKEHHDLWYEETAGAAKSAAE